MNNEAIAQQIDQTLFWTEDQYFEDSALENSVLYELVTLYLHTDPSEENLLAMYRRFENTQISQEKKEGDWSAILALFRDDVRLKALLLSETQPMTPILEEPDITEEDTKPIQPFIQYKED